MGKTGSAFDIAKMIELAKSGMGTIRIGREVGCGPGTVRYHLDRNGIERKGKSNTTFKLLHFTDRSAFNGETPMSRWSVGLMASDGNIKRNTNGLSLTQSAKNKNILDGFQHHIKHTGEQYYSDKLRSYSLHWTNAEHVDDLSKFGVVPAKSLIFRLPSLDLMSVDFLRGYVDGDGCIGLYSNGTEKKYMHLSWAGTPEFIAQCNEWLPVKGRVYSRGNISELCFYGKKAKEVGNLLYPLPGAFMSSKWKRFTEYLLEAR